MAYDDIKKFGEQKYSGMRIGGRHIWHYTNSIWKEEKILPDSWIFRFNSLKRRNSPSPEGSGAAIGTQYHWFILADQYVKKIDKDSYETMMEGIKYKISHRRPYWRKWSSEYPGNVSTNERITAILADILEQIEGNHNGDYKGLTRTYLVP